MTVESVRLRLTLVAPLRLALSVALLVAARAAGSPRDPALLSFASAAFVTFFFTANDPRARSRDASAEPAELPADAKVAPTWAHAVHASFPSTVGVSILAAVALAFQPTLAALLAGILAGLGAAAVLSAYRTDHRLYLEPARRVVFRR